MADQIIKERMTAKAEGELVVFLVGMRINSFWRPRSWLPVFRAMPRMLRELSREKERGMLGYRLVFGSPREITVLQYWSSLECLTAYASDTEGEHRPAWGQLNRRLRAGARVGFWHETFVVPAGAAESFYVNLPPSGLGAATGLEPIAARGERLANRLGHQVRGEGVAPARG
ncbi:DUF4188 domain-containing protein [Streptomyces profundus]|uniref:DUF4188 domain-containing protein n=1 Tax=Streptomyces profundus TaxID=2867410 RepID=UPI001D168A4C|nr:DUF4188 domain-containing protein [Streptomyces sp. MA3_2.13]UED86840.1 DUF4188 domain-containing protein [Streptomyces sp. MA3_2.13]